MNSLITCNSFDCISLAMTHHLKKCLTCAVASSPYPQIIIIIIFIIIIIIIILIIIIRSSSSNSSIISSSSNIIVIIIIISLYIYNECLIWCFCVNAYLPISVVNGSMDKFRLPIFNDTPTNLTYHKGDRAILQCSVNNLGTKQVIPHVV